jgi:uncharacterized membrane protein YsdA (DUF1294 family)
MYRSGQLELQSNSFMQSRIGDRPWFEASVSRGFSSQTLYVFFMPQGVLFLDKKRQAGADRDAARNAMVAGAAVGGLVGALVGSAIGNARSRKNSFVSMLDDVQTISIDAPGTLGRIFGGGTAGWITVRDKRVGKITVEVKKATWLQEATEVIGRRYGERAKINVRWDDAKGRYVPR